MDLFIIPDWAPNIHPLLVHFPIALLMTAALANFVSLFIQEKWWDETKNTTLYLAGTLSAGITYYSGTFAADSVFLPTEAQSVLSEHADWAEYLLWFFVLYALLRVALHWLDIFQEKVVKVIVFITVLPGLFMLFETAEHGGKMVYGYGTGTAQLLQTEQQETLEPTDSTSTPNSFVIKENGSWTWDIQPTSVSNIIAKFHWIEGTVQDLKPMITQTEPPQLKLEATNRPNFFVTHNSYQDVQIDYFINLNDFKGQVKLVHHLQDAENYDFVSLNEEGLIRQGRIENGDRTLFEEGTFEPEGELFVRIVGDGSHFRGYVNKEMEVHGHGDAPERGSVGLKIEGDGLLLISKIELTQL